VPECARACVISAADTTPCIYGDVLCICSASGWFQNLSCCIQPLCSAADIATTIALADAECDIVGVSIPKALECANAAPVSSSVSVEVVVSTVVTGQAAGPGTTEVAASAAGGGPQTETVVASGNRPASTSRVAESTTTGPIVETFTTGILVGGTPTPTSGIVAGGQSSGTGNSPSPTASPSSSGLSRTATIGIGVGVGAGVILLAIIAFLAFCLFRKRRPDNLANNTEGVAGVEVFDVGEDKSGARAHLAAA